MNSEHRGLAALAAQVEHYRLIFRWPERTASLLLPALFVVSVGIHAFAFYLFQVVYPPTLSSPRLPAQVTFLTDATPQGRALLDWVRAQDPATAARVPEITPPGLGEVQYTPSYTVAQALPRIEPPSEEPIAIPAAYTLLDSRDNKPVATEAPRRAVASSLAFSEALRARDAAPSAPVEITGKSSANLRPTVLLVGVDGRGEVRYCFLQESSDNRAGADSVIDKQAEALLRQHAFTHSEAPLEWGFATFTWGAAAHEPRASQPPPAPAAAPQQP